MKITVMSVLVLSQAISNITCAQMPAAIADQYFKSLKSRDKHFIWFEQSGHAIFNTEPLKVEQMLIDSVAHPLSKNGID